jgi:hypothetical protein
MDFLSIQFFRVFIRNMYFRRDAEFFAFLLQALIAFRAIAPPPGGGAHLAPYCPERGARR